MLSFISSLCDIATTLQTDIQNMNRQAEQKKGKRDQALIQIADYNAKKVKLEILMNDLFNGYLFIMNIS